MITDNPKDLAAQKVQEAEAKMSALVAAETEKLRAVAPELLPEIAIESYRQYLNHLGRIPEFGTAALCALPDDSPDLIGAEMCRSQYTVEADLANQCWAQSYAALSLITSPEEQRRVADFIRALQRKAAL